MKKGNKGQALVEFIIILPILIILLLTIFDVGNIFVGKNSLENLSNDAIKLYQDNKSEKEIIKKLTKDQANIKISFKTEGDYTEIIVEKDLNIITPGLNLILKNPYTISVKRVVAKWN